MDFDTQRRVLSAIDRFSDRHRLMIPACFAAKAAAKGFCSAVRFFDMALSDDEGNFLGVKKEPKTKVRDFSLPEDREKHVRSIPLGKRLTAAAAAASFAAMILPMEIIAGANTVSAVLAVSDGIITGLDNSDQLTYTSPVPISSGAIASKKAFAIADGAMRGCTGISSVDTAGSGLGRIGDSAFASCSSLTEIYISADDGITFGKDAFADIAPDSAVYVRGAVSGDNFDRYAEMLRSCITDGKTRILNDRNLVYSLEIPDDVKDLTAKTSEDNVLLSFGHVDDADGYGVYVFSASDGTCTKIGDYSDTDDIGDNIGIAVSSEDLGKFDGSRSVFAVRAYKDVDSGGRTERIYSTRFTLSDEKASAADTLSPDVPGLSLSVSGNSVSASWDRQIIKLAGSAVGEADYYKLYIGDSYETAAFAGIYDSAQIKLPLERNISDDNGYTVVLRAFFDPFRLAENDDRFFGRGQVYDPDIPWVRYSETSAETGAASLDAPSDLSCDLSDSSEYAVLNWESVRGAEGYLLSISGTSAPFSDYDVGNRTSYKLLRSQISDTSAFEFSVQAYSGMTADGSYTGKSKRAFFTPDEPSPSIQGFTAYPGNGKISLYWNEYSGAKFYVVSCFKDGNFIESKTVSDLFAEFTELENGSVYTFSITSDNASASGALANTSAVPADDTLEFFADSLSRDFLTANLAVANSGSDAKLSTPLDVTAYGIDSSVTVSWSPVSGANYYEVYRYFSDIGNYKLVAAVTKPAWTDTSVINGRTYTYYVVACADSTDPDTDDIRSLASIEVSAMPFDSRLTATTTTARQAAQTTAAPSGNTANNSNNNANNTSKTVSAPPAPVDFTVTAGEGQAVLSWSAVTGAQGYQACIVNSQGVIVPLEEVSKPGAVHVGLTNGNTYTYVVRAFTIDSAGARLFGPYSIQKTVTIGNILPAPVDLTAVPGDGLITLTWSAIKDAEGYVVYSYDSNEASYKPVSVVSKPSFVHTGLVNGQNFTYMVTAYKHSGGQEIYSDYSLAVSAVPGLGESGDGRAVHNMYIVGTVPYGLSNSHLISASSDNLAFNTDIDVHFGADSASADDVNNVLKNYARGLDSFDVYPFDITLFVAGTFEEVEPAQGHYVTVNMPVPDKMRKYGDDMQLIHITADGQLEIIPMTFSESSDGTPLAEFKCGEFSPFAFVHYYSAEDLHSGSGTGASGESGTSASGYSLRCDRIVCGYKFRRRNKIYKIVRK